LSVAVHFLQFQEEAIEGYFLTPKVEVIDAAGFFAEHTVD